jgi:hypothetical protein
MSHLISGLLWNTCLAGSLAIVIFLAQQTRYLRIRPHVCHALWLLVLVKLIGPTLFAVPVSIDLARSGRVRNEQLAVTAPAIGNSTSGSAGPVRSGIRGEEAIPAQTVDVMLTPKFAVTVVALRVQASIRQAEPGLLWLRPQTALRFFRQPLTCTGDAE